MLFEEASPVQLGRAERGARIARAPRCGGGTTSGRLSSKVGSLANCGVKNTQDHARLRACNARCTVTRAAQTMKDGGGAIKHGPLGLRVCEFETSSSGVSLRVSSPGGSSVHWTGLLRVRPEKAAKVVCRHTTAIPDTLQVRALAYDHYCDLQRGVKGAVSSRRTAHTAFLAAFSRGVILIGALSKGAPPPSATGVREAPP